MPKILIADDESHILNVVALKLRNAGHEVITATDGAEAYARAVSERPELFVTDFHMPVMTGIDVCLKLRSENAMSLPAVLLTARNNDLDSALLQKAGVIAVVSKPFSPRELLGTVQQALAAA